MAQYGQQNNGSNRLANYRSVADRIDEFWREMRATKTPARIESTLLNADERSIAFRSEVWVNLEGQWVMLANGYAEDMRASAPQGKCMEVAETSAIGRALANAGYTTSKERASREEMESYYAAQDAEAREKGVAVMPEATAGPTPIKKPKPTKVEQAEVFEDQATIAQAAKVGVVTAAGTSQGETIAEAVVKAGKAIGATMGVPEIASPSAQIDSIRVFPDNKAEAARLAKMPPPFRAFIEKMWQYVEGDGESFDQIKARFAKAKPRMSEPEVKEARHQLALLKTRIEEIEASAPSPELVADVASELADLTDEERSFMAAS